MSTLKNPAILIDLGHVGENGLPLNTAAWFRKELELCKEWGFQLKYSNDRVSLRFDQDQLVPYWIQKETPGIAWDWLRVHGFFRVGSTNSEALELARKGTPSGTLVYTEEQTDGRGRNGRSWFSVAGKGLYFTLVIRPTRHLRFWPLLTHAASVALVETLKDLYSPLKIIPHPLALDLKWPNDVLLSGKKCAGILLETMIEGENHAAMVGLGINVGKGSVPESLKDTATCLDDMADAIVPRRQLLVRFLQNFQEFFLMFEQGKHSDLLKRWKSHSSMWDGAHVWITEGNVRRSGITCGLNEIGALLIRTPEGNLETVLAGDISVRKDTSS